MSRKGMTKREKLRMARRNMTQRERESHTPPFNSEFWIKRAVRQAKKI